MCKSRLPAATPSRTRHGSTTPTARPWEVYTVLADAPAETAPGLLHRGLRASSKRSAVRRRQHRFVLLSSSAPRPTVNDVGLWRRLLAEFVGQRLPGRRGHRLGHRGPTALAGQRRSGAIRERGGHRGGAVRHHLDVRTRSREPTSIPWSRSSTPPSAGSRGATPLAYLPAQVAGCIGGAVLANLMFAKAAVTISTHHRATGAHFLSEVVATTGLLLVIFALARTGRGSHAPRRGRRLHRCRLLLHQLDQLRQPGHHRRTHVLQHFRRHRPRLGAGLHRRPDRRRGCSAFALIKVALPGPHPPRRPRSSSPPPPAPSGHPATWHQPSPRRAP